MRPGSALVVRVLAIATSSVLSSCGGRTIEAQPVCAHARIVASDPKMITPTGRILEARAEGWAVSQLEADGTLTPITTLVTGQNPLLVGGWLAHDPVSGRMWLLEGYFEYDESPASLYQFAADGQLEWMIELVDYERPVRAGTLHYHEGSIYVSLTMDGVWPSDPLDPNFILASLILERRDLTGALVWTRSDYAPPNTGEALSTARLLGVSGSALSMVATPPLVDYGDSFPLTVDIETGEVLWSGTDGHDPLHMAVGEGQLYLGWVRPQHRDLERWPEVIVLEPTSSSVSVHAPSSGAQTSLSTVEWDAIDWTSPANGGQNFAFGWMGAQLVSLLVVEGEHGVTVHDADGELLCKGRLDLEFDSIGHYGVGIEGRSQFAVRVSVAVEGSDDGEPGLLLIEPLTEG